MVKLQEAFKLIDCIYMHCRNDMLPVLKIRLQELIDASPSEKSAIEHIDFLLTYFEEVLMFIKQKESDVVQSQLLDLINNANNYIDSSINMYLFLKENQRKRLGKPPPPTGSPVPRKKIFE